MAIRYRDLWYGIDDADPHSKRSFKFLRLLVGIRLGKGGSLQDAPVLTVPVG